MRLIVSQVLLGVALLLAAALWPRPESPLLVLARDDDAVARVFAWDGWRVLDLREAFGMKLLHLMPETGSASRSDIPSEPGVLLIASMAAGALCRTE